MENINNNMFNSHLFLAILNKNNYLNFSSQFLNLISSLNLNFLKEEFIVFITEYWQKVQNTGFGIAQIDDFIILFILIRLIILTIRYNIITAFIITVISIASGYLWYFCLLRTLAVYEQILYTNSLTFQLGVDITQLRRIGLDTAKSTDYQIRTTNPIGILIYAISKGSVYEEHKIDPISMLVSVVNYPRLTERYYYFSREILPIVIRAGLKGIEYIQDFAFYSYIVRVNKNICPYLIRWHWSTLLMLKFLDGFYYHLCFRIIYYSEVIVYPQILEAQRMNIVLPYKLFEMEFLQNLAFTMVCLHLGFIIFAMLHALGGQYFFVPFFIRNVELHIGPRSNSRLPMIFEGGGTDWQKDGVFTRLIPWYGWFGNGTDKPNFITFIIQKFIFKPIYKLIKRGFRLMKKYMKNLFN